MQHGAMASILVGCALLTTGVVAAHTSRAIASVQAEVAEDGSEAAPAGTRSGLVNLVRYEAGKLSVDVAGVSLQEVLDEVGRQSGATIDSGPEGGRVVSGRFDRQPLDVGLRRLHPEASFVLVYAPEGRSSRLRRVRVLATAASAAARPATAPSAPAGRGRTGVLGSRRHVPPVDLDDAPRSFVPVNPVSRILTADGGDSSPFGGADADDHRADFDGFHEASGPDDAYDDEGS